MKKYFVLIFCFILLTKEGSSQNYKLFQSDSLRLYKSPISDKLFGLFIDSVSSTGQDTTYYNFGIVDDYSLGICIMIDRPIFIGKKVIVKPNGATVLFNVQEDSIFINTIANIGDSWVMYKYANGDNVIAQVDSINQITILNLPDSVKSISLHVIDSIGNPVTSSINNLVIQLSKDHGIYKSLYFPLFPTNFDPYDLQNCRMMTIGDLYHYSIGDTIQIAYVWEMQGQTNPATYFTTIIQDVYYSPSGDTMYYRSDSTFNYTYKTNLNDPVEPGYPGRIIGGDCHYFQLYFDSSCAGRRMVLDDLLWTNADLQGDDSCYFYLFEPGRVEYVYYEGTGSYLYYFSDPPGSPQGGFFSWDNFNFYRHGSYHCGTFFDTAIGIDEIYSDRKTSFLTYAPNPISNKIIFKRKESVSPGKIQITIYDLIGKILITKSLAEAEDFIILDMNEMPEGTYYFTAAGETDKVQSGKFIKINQ